MLRIVIEEEETYNEETETFETFEGTVLYLEHSLLSLSKWESFYEKPFLSQDARSAEEILTYIQGMILDPEVDPRQIYRCSQKNIFEIQAYIDSPQSATTFGQMPERQGRGEVITSELIYYWMTAFQIPFETEKWHLNRLFSLIRICNIKNSPESQKKMTAHDSAQRRELNAQRRKEYNTTG